MNSETFNRNVDRLQFLYFLSHSYFAVAVCILIYLFEQSLWFRRTKVIQLTLSEVKSNFQLYYVHCWEHIYTAFTQSVSVKVFIFSPNSQNLENKLFHNQTNKTKANILKTITCVGSDFWEWIQHPPSIKSSNNFQNKSFP